VLSYHEVLRPQHFLYFLPLPQGHGSFRPTFLSGESVSAASNTSGVCALEGGSGEGSAARPKS
jgi:hypothetical protein